MTSPNETTHQTVVSDSTRLRAAYLVGRLTNRLRFTLEHVALLGDESYIDEANELWDQLALAVRGTTDNAVVADDLQQVVTTARNACWTTRDAEWYAEHCYRACKELNQPDPCGDLSPADEYNRACEEIGGPLTQSVAVVCRHIEAFLNEQQKRLLRLGQHVDRAVRPENAFTEMRAVETVRVADPEPGAPLRLLGEHSPASAAPPIPALPNRPYPERTCPPDDQWRRELMVRWEELGLPSSKLPTGVRDSSDTAEVTTLAYALDSAVEAALGQAVAASVKSGIVRDPATEARDKWLYEQCCKGVAYAEIGRKLRRKPTSWGRIESPQGIKDRANAYAERHELSPIPKCAKGRRQAK